MDRREAKKIGPLLQQFLKSSGLEAGYAEYRLKKSWKDLLGPMVARKTKNLQIRNRTLFVTLHSSVMRNELEMMKQSLIPRLNEAAGSSVIDDIVLR
jgi:predicted nucleic acid-binding Zn ribbon protein